ncbi:acyl-CoA dehydrogenase family protein [Streptomyces hyderabadensis]|uniref:Acyl-CoA dehydrogenase family protein n=1 Tax=Streptomyces hyderabadensis TaxID=598549 RepID=A0ABP9HGL2_9ACTN|nr:acyl-CoA dehydrogenase family protein [Streptomyces hyderabadensis]
MPEPLVAARPLVRGLVGDKAGAWDLAGELPADLLTDLGARGLLCAQVGTEYGGLGASSLANGEFTAFVGGLCSSLRSVMTSQGMAAWTIQRLGDAGQRAEHLRHLVSGGLAAVAFSEPDAGSDLSAMAATITPDGDDVVVTGRKVWTTAAAYADRIVVFGRYGDGAAAVVVPVSRPGVRVTRVADPLGCRAAGHANVELTDVRVPAGQVLGGTGQSLPLLVTAALAYGRMSVAWGCVGILRSCVEAVGAHARERRQFGTALIEHQLVARHMAELYADERSATLACAHASRCWDEGSPDMVAATVLAKYTGSRHAARGAATAVQVLASAGARDGHAVARAYRDAKLMEIIEGSSEICQLMLSRHALAADYS